MNDTSNAIHANVSACTMWNCKSLSPPVYCELKVSLTTAQKGCLLIARNCLKKAERLLQDHSRVMSTELYVTKRIIYKLSSQFRTDKALHTLGQVHSCMKRLKEVDIGKQLADILLLLDSVSSEGDTEVYLVSRQMIEYHLVKLQGIGALLRQTVQYSQQTFIHVRQHLELGNMIPQNLVLLALTSRIWYVCNSLCLYICDWYRKLYRCLDIFKPTTVPWLHEGGVAVIEADLTDWLKQLIEDTDLQEPDSEMVKCIEAERAKGNSTFAFGFDDTLAQEDLGEPIKRETSTAKRVDMCIEQLEEHLAKGKTGKKRKQEIETIPNAKRTKANNKNKKQKLSLTDTNGKLEQQNVDTFMKLKHKPSTKHAYAQKQKHGQLNTTGDAASSPVGAVPMHTGGAHHLAQRSDNGRISQLYKQQQTQQETLDRGHTDLTITAKKKKKRKKKKKKAA